jgi:hypothetical protein
MNTSCDACGDPIVGEPPITNRQGDFCGLSCYVAFLHDWPDTREVPVLSDEAYLWNPDEPPDVTAFCHP